MGLVPHDCALASIEIGDMIEAEPIERSLGASVAMLRVLSRRRLNHGAESSPLPCPIGQLRNYFENSEIIFRNYLG